jgi:thymidine kinase
MAKLYFRYSAMNSGKTTALLQAAYNYEERGMSVIVIKPAIDTKGNNELSSRLGTVRKADIVSKGQDNIRAILDARLADTPLRCVLVDEAQFLTPKQVDELFWFAVEKDIPVLAYGLRSDFQTKGFPGSTRLLELAHELQELKTICGCGRKAVFNGRKQNNKFISSGEQVAIDGKGAIDYESLCAACYKNLVLDN